MTMIERIARAICEQEFWRRVTSGTPNADELVLLVVNATWTQYLATARGAVEAMREPPEAMHNAGRAEMISNTTGSGDGGYGFEIDDAEPDPTWRAMIDAILEENP